LRDHGLPRDLLDSLIAARDPETGQGFSPAQLRDQVATMILAGHETTALALFWSLYLLALSPAAQERVAGEAETLGSGAGGSQLSGLTYTRAVVDEAMRLYPPAYVIVRTVRQAERFAGVDVNARDLVIISPWVLHRHRRRWHAPDVFNPERFLPGAPAVDRFSYLPFGAGPRVCIGAHFALTEATLVLSELVRTFRIEVAGTRPVLPVAIVTTQPDQAPLFRLHRR
jgi:cytochrome P450